STTIVVVILPPITTLWIPGVSGCTSVTQPCATDRPSVPAGCPKTLSAGRTISRSGVSTSATVTAIPSTLIVGATGASNSRAHVRRSASVVPSNVLHSHVLPTTNSFVPVSTVHDLTPP
ncbi:MAG: hypothetical protein QOD72_3034, partial [Acidimicrobiaceae bacterium]|nr:hypothetical protein [Acidimicrobiaceae bacterium]